jgi:hypothetical protein
MIALKTFTGEFPRSQPQLLPDNAAAAAVDCDFTRGNLIGIRSRALLPGFNAPVGVKSMFVYDGLAASMFAWTRDVDAVRSPVPNDQGNRFYWTDGSGFYVSRGDVGGNGKEPSESNRYKVGCPTPAAAMTIIEDQSPLALPGVAATAYAVFCEGTDGSVKSERALELPKVTVSRQAWRGDWATGISCGVGGSSGGSSGGTTGGTSLRFRAFYGPYAVLDNPAIPASAWPQVRWIHNADYLNVPWGTQIASDTDVSESGYKTPFYSIGNGWYCTDKTQSVPAGSVDTAGGDTVATTPAMRLTFTMASGSQSTAIIRPGGANTVPSEFSGYAFTFNYTAGALALNIDPKADYKEFRAYSYSYVNMYGEESGLAEPVTVDIVEGQPVTLQYTNLPDSAGYCPISMIRIYRTATGSGGTDYSYVDEFVHNDTLPRYPDSKRGDQLGPPSPAAGFEAPPQNLRGLCQMSNGILAAFSGNDLYFMEPYLPYAYRPSTIKPLPHTIVGICPTDDGLYVTTTAHPYLITGVSPDTMTDRKIPAVQAGVSKGSLCSLGATVAYASHDGIVMLRGIDASLDMSFQFFTRDSWRDRYRNKLHLMRLNAHDGNIVVWFEDGTPGFLVRVEEGSPSLTALTDPVYAAFMYPMGDALYVAQGGSVYEFKGESGTKAFRWESKDFILPKPANFGCLQLVGKGAVTFAVTADGIVRHLRTVTLTGTDTDLYRLPAGFLCRRWSLSLAGAAGAEVSECYLAVSPLELPNV